MLAADSALELQLLSVGFGSVDFLALLPDGSERTATVIVGSGPTWRRACRFPNVASEGGQSLGDDALDEQVRRRAGEELVRLAAAVDAIERGRGRHAA
jgi:hypothetical protein